MESRQNTDLERAMLIDRIGRLERQLEDAEQRVRNAEQSARDSKSTLADTLLKKARHQKSGHDADAAQSRQEADPSAPDDAAARALRTEYEQKFRIARDRMAREFQERLSEAQAAWKADATRQADVEESSGRFYHSFAQSLPILEAKSRDRRWIRSRTISAAAAALRNIPRGRARRVMLPALIVSGAVGTYLAWAALPITNDRSDSVLVTTAETVLAPSQATPVPIPPPVAAETPPVETHPAAPPPVKAEKVAPSETAAEAKPPAEMPPDVSPDPSPLLVQEHREVLERNAVLILEMEGLRQRLDAAVRRANTAETAARAERKRAAAVSNRADHDGPQRKSAPSTASGIDRSREAETTTAPQAAFPASQIRTVE